MMIDEEKAEEQIKEWESVLYSYQKKKSAEQLTKAKEIIRELIFDLVAVDGEQANELDSVKKAKQFFREMK